MPLLNTIEKTNKENKRLWVAALRSGEFEQGKGAMCVTMSEKQGRIARFFRLKPKITKKFCCLGVACEVAMRNGVYLNTRRNHKGEVIEVLYNGIGWTLPTSVMKWLGVSSTNPIISNNNNIIDAAHANDYLDWDFAKIADAIEEYYEL